MKKLGKFLVAGALAAVATVGLVGCGESEKTYTGSYTYINAWTPAQDYGVTVTVKVKGSKIVSVECAADTDTVHNVTPTWANHDATVAALPDYLKKFEGKSVKEIKNLEVKTTNAVPDVGNASGQGDYILTGSTQTSGRIILAIQNALNQVKNGTSYGLVHGGGYVGKATISYKEGNVTDATLTEICFPTEVQAPAAVGDDYKVTVTVENHGSDVEKTFYKIFKVGSVEFTYDATAKAYKTAEGTTFEAWVATGSNARVYAETALANKIQVKVGEGTENKGEWKTDILNKASLCKDDNGYWTVGGVSKWKANRDATIAYVKAHGVDNLLKLTQDTAANSATKNQWFDGTLSTGATWKDFNSDTTGKNYVSYAQLIVNASNAAK